MKGHAVRSQAQYLVKIKNKQNIFALWRTKTTLKIKTTKWGIFNRTKQNS